MVGGAGMSCNSRCTRPANGSGRRGSTPCRRRLSAGRKLDTSLWKDVIAGLPPGKRQLRPHPARPAGQARAAAARAAAAAGRASHAGRPARPGSVALTGIYHHALTAGYARGFLVTAGIILLALVITLATIRIRRSDLTGVNPI